MRRHTCLVIILCLSLAAPLLAEGQKPQSGPRQLAGVAWLGTLDAARAKAAPLGRPIVWLRLLGDLEGLT